MSPGQGVDKSILSTADLKSHTDKVHEWGPQELVKALTNDGFSAKMKNPHRNEDESLCDLICFGSSEVCTIDIRKDSEIHRKIPKNARKIRTNSGKFVKKQEIWQFF